jgi:cellulose synthase/poly-beta-1,6-N-acetylglucosamine synthase-like glycosyltransferase
MKISFVIPAYNEETLIKKCLDSIKKEIATRPDVQFEIIVANNASTDHTREVALSVPGVKVVDEPHKGVAWARFAGHRASTGEIVANLDADTIVPEGWLKTVIDEFSNDPKLIALTGPYIYYDAPASVRSTTKTWYAIGYGMDRFFHYVLGRSAIFQGGNFVVRRDALEKAGGHNTSIEFWGEDTDLGRRLNKIGKVKWTFKLPMYSSYRRLKAGGMMKTGFLYAITFTWIVLTGKPLVRAYSDVRE